MVQPARKAAPSFRSGRGEKGRGILRFFFQAEDGIRDKLVTGVQTCALPIWSRSCSGGMTSATCAADAPSPFEVDIFLPPMLRNSYGTFRGGSLPNTSRAIALDRSREPPFVERSLPAGSMVTPNRSHFAAQSTLYGSLAWPPNGETSPTCPQPRAQVTRSGRHS